ncbi:hypothetical protein LINPERHAP1_LOCUS32046, partial [Linum perenne]
MQSSKLSTVSDFFRACAVTLHFIFPSAVLETSLASSESLEISVSGFFRTGVVSLHFIFASAVLETFLT